VLKEFELTAPVETDRLLLRPYETTDFDALFAMRSRDDVTRYLYWGAQSDADVRATLERKIGSVAIRSEGDVIALAIVLEAPNEVVGDVILQLVSEQHEQGEIGFIVHPDHQGRGFATEAARAVLRLAFEDVELHRVVGRVEPRNVGSARVLEKLGMRREAHLVENEYVKGEWQSELIYAMLAREWRQATSKL